MSNVISKDIKLTDIFNLDTEEFKKLDTIDQSSTLLVQTVTFPINSLLNALDKISVEVTLPSVDGLPGKLEIKPRKINYTLADLEKCVIVGEQTELQQKFSKFKWFKIVKETDVVFVNFFQNDKFVAVCNVEGRLAFYSNSTLNLIRKEMERVREVIDLLLEEKVMDLIHKPSEPDDRFEAQKLLVRKLAKIIDRNSGQILKAFKNLDIDVHGNQKLNSESPEFTNICEQNPVWFVIKCAVNDNKQLCVIGHGSACIFINIVITDNKIEYKNAVYHEPISMDAINCAEAELDNRLHLLTETLDDENFETELPATMTDKDTLLELVKKLENKIQSLDDNLDVESTCTSKIRVAAQAIIDEIEEIEDRAIFMDRFQRGRNNRLNGSDSDRHDREHYEDDRRPRTAYSRSRETRRFR